LDLKGGPEAAFDLCVSSPQHAARHCRWVADAPLRVDLQVLGARLAIPTLDPGEAVWVHAAGRDRPIAVCHGPTENAELAVPAGRFDVVLTAGEHASVVRSCSVAVALGERVVLPGNDDRASIDVELPEPPGAG